MYPAALGFHPGRWAGIGAARHGSLLLLLCSEIALPEMWHSMGVSPPVSVGELKKRVLVSAGIEVKLKCVIL